MGGLLSNEIPPFEPVVPPRDSEGYTVSFSLEEKDAIHDFFDKYGFVVINGVLNEEETSTGLDTIWSAIEKPEVLERNKPETWDKFPGGGAAVGIVGNVLPRDKLVLSPSPFPPSL